MEALAIDHIGMAVWNVDEAAKPYIEGFRAKLGTTETLPSHGVRVAFLSLLNTRLELLEPLSESDGALRKFLNTRGPGLHHLGYLVADIHSALEHFASLGHRLIDSKPRRGAENALVAFIHPKTFGGVLIELCQSDKSSTSDTK